jgi:spermidine synthase
VLLLGAGDGLALREILKYPAVREVVVIELDPEMLALATRHPTLVKLNGKSFADPRVRVIVGDASRRCTTRGRRSTVPSM